MLLLFLPKKIVSSFWVGSMLTLFSCKLHPKKHFLEVLPYFFQNYWIATEVINTDWILYFIWKSTKKESRYGLRGKIWAKLGPMLWKDKTGIINGLFSNFSREIHLKARSSSHRNTWMQIEGQNSKKYHIWRKLKLDFRVPYWVKIAKNNYGGFCSS